MVKDRPGRLRRSRLLSDGSMPDVAVQARSYLGFLAAARKSLLGMPPSSNSSTETMP